MNYTAEEQPIYYMFNMSKGGFVILSAEDSFYPVLGFSLVMARWIDDSIIPATVLRCMRQELGVDV